MIFIKRLGLQYLKSSKIQIFLCVQILASLVLLTTSSAQSNLVPNHSFEDILDCNFDYGAADYASPWKIVNEDVSSPDLFHVCATNVFYQVPLVDSSQEIFPNSGDGMVGLVNLVMGAEERIYARLLGDLPKDVDIYLAFSTIPNKKTDADMSLLCYSNTQSLAFSDIQFQSKIVALQSDAIIDNTEDWTKLQTCYQATGEEELVLLGNYKLSSETLMDCDYIDPGFNFAYFFVDDIIVAPFDVLPDTLFICGDEVLEIDISFYDLSLLWNDGWIGGLRDISEGGIFKVMGDAGNCFLEDETLVIKISDEIETINVDLCENGETTLNSPFLSEWNTGEISSSLLVSRPGIFTANLLSPCGMASKEFVVEEKDCSIQYFVPNIFSPNNDGINDKIEFSFKSDFEYTGELNIFDRWGNLLLSKKNDSTNPQLSWDGSFKGAQLAPAVFVWVYSYSNKNDNKIRIISGDITLMR